MDHKEILITGGSDFMKKNFVKELPFNRYEVNNILKMSKQFIYWIIGIFTERISILNYSQIKKF